MIFGHYDWIADDIHPSYARTLKRCTKRERGSMASDFNWALKWGGTKNCKFLWTAHFVVEGKLVGWALYYDEMGQDVLQVYVQRKWRRQGVGTKLIETVTKYKQADNHVIHVDQKNRPFWESLSKKEIT